MIEKGIFDKGFIWKPSNCECKCDKLCDVGEYLDNKNCQCRKKLVDKSVEECNENVDEVKIAGMALFYHGNDCKILCRIYVVLMAIAFTTSTGIGTYMNHSYLKKILLVLSL